MGKTDDFFIEGKLSVLLDGQWGSSGKGRLVAFLVKNSDKVDFVCTTSSPNASHTVKHKDGTEIVYKCLPSAAHLHERLSKVFIGQGAVIDIEAFMEEKEKSGIPDEKIAISPITPVVQPIDKKYEKGEAGFDGGVAEDHDGIIKTGTTASGSGSARARKLLRRPNVVLARDVEELEPYVCNVKRQIIERLNKGESGLLEVAQGFPLSYGMSEFYPFTTSRNVTVSAALDDMFLPPSVVGNVCLNMRTFPIRIHPYKYITIEEETDRETVDLSETENKETLLSEVCEKFREKYPSRLYQISVKDNEEELEKVAEEEEKSKEEIDQVQVKDVVVTSIPGVHLYWDEVQNEAAPFEKIESYSGDSYPDQEEITWNDVKRISGAPGKIMETTTLTKLPRRVFTFSKMNLEQAIRYNQTSHNILLSFNFLNYLDYGLYGNKLQSMERPVEEFLSRNVHPVTQKFDNVRTAYLGTSEYSEDTAVLQPTSV